jgi:hypothetical protein
MCLYTRLSCTVGNKTFAPYLCFHTVLTSVGAAARSEPVAHDFRYLVRRGQ